MQYEEFIDRVRDRIAADSDEEAVRATEATLHTLSERLDLTNRRQLAAQLPKELQEMLSYAHEEKQQQLKGRFMLEEFYKRVAARLDIRYEPAENISRAVMSVLSEAVTEGELEEVLSDIDSDYQVLFEI